MPKGLSIVLLVFFSCQQGVPSPSPSHFLGKAPQPTYLSSSQRKCDKRLKAKSKSVTPLLLHSLSATAPALGLEERGHTAGWTRDSLQGRGTPTGHCLSHRLRAKGYDQPLIQGHSLAGGLPGPSGTQLHLHENVDRVPLFSSPTGMGSTVLKAAGTVPDSSRSSRCSQNVSSAPAPRPGAATEETAWGSLIRGIMDFRLEPEQVICTPGASLFVKSG